MAGQAASPHKVGPGPAIEELVRRLSVLAAAGLGDHPPEQDDSEAETVLFDIDVDGSRYLLIRLPKADRPRVQLSPREQEIVRMVAQGHSNKVIADVLAISTWTVCTHLRRIFAKCGVGSRAAMVARLRETGVWGAVKATPEALRFSRRA